MRIEEVARRLMQNTLSGSTIVLQPIVDWRDRETRRNEGWVPGDDGPIEVPRAVVGYEVRILTANTAEQGPAFSAPWEKIGTVHVDGEGTVTGASLALGSGRVAAELVWINEEAAPRP